MSTESKTQHYVEYSDLVPNWRCVQIGNTVCDDRLTVLELMGLGGMGAVFRVRDEDYDSVKALKICLSPDQDRRFDREVRNMRKVKHPNVMSVLDSGICEEGAYHPEWLFPFFTMPLASKSLADEIPNIVGDEDRVLKILREIVDGLTAIHETGMVHRDIKPQNVLLIDGKWCVADLGLSVLTSRETTTLTQSNQFLGTYKYAAPEQFSDAKHSTIQTDVFQLGKLAYEMLTGKDPAVPITKGMLLEAGINRALEIDPGMRFASPREMLGALLVLRMYGGGDSARTLEEIAGFGDGSTIGLSALQKFAWRAGYTEEQVQQLADVCKNAS